MTASRSPAGTAQDRERSMLERLRTSGLKLTPQRLAIVRELADDVTHPTAQELFERLSVVMPTMSFATVYNTLGALATAGLCQSKSFGPGPARFDPNTEPHHHAVCDGCGSVADVPVAHPNDAVPAPGVQALGATAAGFSVRTIERVYRGLCAACQRRAGSLQASLDGEASAS